MASLAVPAAPAPSLRLLVGSKRYSSWSLRAWLYLRHHGLTFSETLLELETPACYAALQGISPTLRVPALVADGLCLWESLAILEFLAESYPATAGWPAEAAARAVARCVAAEMHAGFAAMRSGLPFNCARGGRPRATWPGAALDRDLVRFAELVSDCRARFGGGGPWLFGSFSVADCMLAPLALRTRQYGVSLAHAPAAQAWVAAVEAHPAVAEWTAAGAAEARALASEEVD